MSSILKEAVRLADLGFSVLWLHKRSKRPIAAEWTELEFATPKRLKATYREGNNLGVRLGRPSRIGDHFLHVIDMDIRDPEFTDEARAKVANLFKVDLDDFSTVISGSGGDSRHFYLLTTEPFRSRKLWRSKESFVDDEGKKHWCAEIEFFGTGKQVALPPSIHPSGKPYRWEVPLDVDRLPVIDAELLDELVGHDDPLSYEEVEEVEPLGLSRGEALDMITELQDWADDRETWARVGMALRHEFGEDGWDIFDAWSKKGKGYDRRENRAQWKSFKDKRHSVVTMRSIAKEVGERAIYDIIDNADDDDEDLIGAKDEADEDIDFAAMFEEDDNPRSVENRVRRRALAGIPKHLLTIPGALGKAVDLYNETCVQYQPQFAVQTAIALGSVVLGRHHKLIGVGNGSYTSLYLMVLGETGCGKEFTRTLIRRVLQECELLGLMVNETYASTAGLFTELFHKPRHVIVEDEIGLKRGTAIKSGDPNAEAISTKLTSLFGDLEGVVEPPAYSMRGKSPNLVKEERNRAVIRPAITLVGMSTPTTFFDNLSHAQVLDGFMNRLLIVNSRIPKGMSLRQSPKPIPSDLKEWVEDYGFTDRMWDDRDSNFDKSYGLGVHEDPMDVDEPTLYELTEDAKAFEGECERKFVDLYNQYQPIGLHHLFARSHEMMLRLALIVALSCRKKRIEKQHFEWAFDYVHFYTMRMVEDGARLIGSSPIVRIADDVLELLRTAGPKGLAKWEIAKNNYRFEKLETRQQDEVLARLIGNNNVREVQFKSAKGTKGGRKPKPRYIHPKYDEE